MHVVTQIRLDEVVSRDGVLREVVGEFRIGTDVGNAVRRIDVLPTGDVVEEDERVAPSVVLVTGLRREAKAPDFFPGAQVAADRAMDDLPLAAEKARRAA